MDFWKDCPDVLITIFKNFDLKTRLKANQVCQRWYELLKDPRANMEDVSSISLKKFDRAVMILRLWTNTLENIIETTMEGLSNHVGKADKFLFEEHDLNIASFVSRMINDGGMKIKMLTSDFSIDFSIVSTWINAITPSSIRELDLGIKYRQARQHRLLVCDWSRFSQLERLSLDDIFIDLSATTFPLLKYLKIFNRNRENKQVLTDLLNSTLPYLPTLEDLYLSEFYFDEKLVQHFLRLIKNKLPKLSFLQFERVKFDLSKINNQAAPIFKDAFTIDLLKEIRFETCFLNWLEVAQLFLRHCSLDIIYMGLIVGDCLTRCLNETALLINKSNTSLELSTDRATREMASLDFPNILKKLSFRSINSTQTFQQFLGSYEYEKLIEVKLERIEDINCISDEILKFLAQSCPWLKKLHIPEYGRGKESGLKYFLIHWDERRSKQLSITCEMRSMDNLFGTSFEKDSGILDEHWMTEKRKKTSDDEKR